MNRSTEQTRRIAYEILRSAGYKVVDASAGGRVLVDIDAPDGWKLRALVKTGSLGRAMVKAKSGDPDAVISGFGADIEAVLFAIGDKDGGVSAYLVPEQQAQDAFRKAHRERRGTSEKSAANTTWVIYFDDKGEPAANGYAETWKSYRINPSDGEEVIRSATAGSARVEEGGLSIGEAKRRLSITLGVPVTSIKISIEA
jgi:hypothetical protein